MKITIFSTSTCSYCHALAAWLDEKQISYRQVITDVDPAGMEEFMNRNDGEIGVPYSILEDNKGQITKIIGFDQAKFKQVLGLA